MIQESEAIVNIVPGDERGVVNVLEYHPSLPVLATSGEYTPCPPGDERGVVNVLEYHPISLPTSPGHFM